MKCKHLKTRSRKYRYYNYCTKLKKEIQYNDCKICNLKEYKSYKPLKQKTSKQAKIEKNRFSLFTDDLSKCYFCPNKKEHIHEIFRGRNRSNSMKYGLCLPICHMCHDRYQDDPIFNEIWHIKGQNKFEEIYPDLEFIKLFGKNYKK